VRHKGPETAAFSGYAAKTRIPAGNQDCLVVDVVMTEPVSLHLFSPVLPVI
jgi:hypothetical protein